MRSGPPARPLQDRFWEKVDIRGDNECWPWLADKTIAGYGLFRGGFSRCASRVAYALVNGEFQRTLQVMHLCHNRACCNPRHLVLGTAQENCLHDSVSGKLQKNSPTEIVGVRWREDKQAWQAQGTIDDKAKSLYHGKDRDKAVAARKLWEQQVRAKRLSFLPPSF